MGSGGGIRRPGGDSSGEKGEEEEECWGYIGEAQSGHCWLEGVGEVARWAQSCAGEIVGGWRSSWQVGPTCQRGRKMKKKKGKGTGCVGRNRPELGCCLRAGPVRLPSLFFLFWYFSILFPDMLYNFCILAPNWLKQICKLFKNSECQSKTARNKFSK
jgi:hypothetical protein